MTQKKYKDQLTELVHKLSDSDISWQIEAACLDTGNEKYFADPNKDHTLITDAKKVCKTCDVRWRCLDFALNNNIKHGVWGGFTPSERNSYLKGKVR
jgi:WhiB family redox-sensing transcriptional regulator